MLSYSTVEFHTLELLKGLMKENLLQSMRLVGGTSLALQYGHRRSVDLDFFGQQELEAEDVKEVLRRYGVVQVIKEIKGIKIYVVNGVKVDFVTYPYVWLDGVIVEDGLRLASERDIAAMKIGAIEGRGTKKDFIDLYFLLQHYSLKEIIGFYKQKYSESSEFRALRCLSYFEDADPQLMPKMFSDVTWEEIKMRILREVQVY